MNGYWIFIVILWAAFILYMGHSPRKKEDPNLIKTEQGLTSKIEFQGHSYVVWSVNMGGGIVHDPDCTCNNKKE